MLHIRDSANSCIRPLYLGKAEYFIEYTLIPENFGVSDVVYESSLVTRLLSSDVFSIWLIDFWGEGLFASKTVTQR